LGPVSPGEFVPLAGGTGGSRGVTNWVLAAAIRQMGEWRRMGLELDLAVNLSAPDILDSDLGDAILALLRQHRVESSSLLLEITESAVMRDAQLAVRNMQLLRIAGVRFSIDDFGTGHSSLSQLSTLPVDELKIDRSFISEAASGSVTIVTSTIELGHRMGLKVVAEGVEDPAAWNLLRRLGCDFAQGYLISPPMPAAEVPAFIQQANQLLPASDSTLLQLRVREVFAQHGTVESVSIITDRDTGRPRGFGFVEMSRADASRAIQNINGKELGGRALRVNEAQERSAGNRGGGGPKRW